jgi:hypothetical protein
MKQPHLTLVESMGLPFLLSVPEKQEKREPAWKRLVLFFRR